jgi:hypothetical protein
VYSHAGTLVYNGNVYKKFSRGSDVIGQAHRKEFSCHLSRTKHNRWLQPATISAAWGVTSSCFQTHWAFATFYVQLQIHYKWQHQPPQFPADLWLTALVHVAIHAPYVLYDPCCIWSAEEVLFCVPESESKSVVI